MSVCPRLVPQPERGTNRSLLSGGGGLSAVVLALLVLPLVVPQSLTAATTNLFSPAVSYLYSDAGAVSPAVSYRYLDGGGLSPVVSYLYLDWPGDTNITLQTSLPVSFYFQAVSPGNVSLKPSPTTLGAVALAFSIPTDLGENYLIEYKDTLLDPAWRWLQTIFGNGQVQAFLQDLNPFSGFFRVRTFSGGFLSFPIKNLNPSTAQISAVMDHSEPTGCSNGIVVAFTGETGTIDFGHDAWFTSAESTACPNDILYGFANGPAGNMKPFLVNGHYTGTYYLYYDGHTGYDFPYDHSYEVVATAAGIVHKYVPPDDYNTVWIDHANGYSSYYLHMLPADTAALTDGASVTQGQHLGYCGNYYKSPGGVPNHLHFTVKKNGIRVDPYGWSGPQGQDPTPVDGVPGHDNVILWNGQ